MAEAETPADPDAEPQTAASGSHQVAKKAGPAVAGLALLWLVGVLLRRRRH
jgi:hypothetical protein